MENIEKKMAKIKEAKNLLEYLRNTQSINLDESSWPEYKSSYEKLMEIIKDGVSEKDIGVQEDYEGSSESELTRFARIANFVKQ